MKRKREGDSEEKESGTLLNSHRPASERLESRTAASMVYPYKFSRLGTCAVLYSWAVFNSICLGVPGTGKLGAIDTKDCGRCALLETRGN